MRRDTLTDRRRTTIGLAALGAIVAVSRLPQLLSPNLLVDGDEAVLGLMARHLALGREFPIFFWGQHYGFSSFEAAAAAASFRLFGVGAIPLKLAMLGLWTIGVLFFFLALSRFVACAAGFWITAVFALNPAWAVWSMKARGGYVTAFTASAVLLWLIVRRTGPETFGRWIAAGLLTAVIFLAQPLWLAGVLPIAAAVLIARSRPSYGVAYICSAAVPILIARLAIPGSDAWSGPALGNPVVWTSWRPVAHQIYTHLTGAYYLAWAVDPPGPATAFVAAIWCGILAAAAAMQLYRVVTGLHNPVSYVLFLAVCATIAANWVLLFARDPRYMLPLTGFLVPLTGIEVIDLVDRRIVSTRVAVAVTSIALLLGSASMVEFRAFAYLWKNPPNSLSEVKRLQQVINAVRSRGVTHVFSMNGLLDPQLMFYSDEQIVSRATSLQDRRPAYVAQVDRALAAGAPVAVVGYTDTSGAPGCWDVPICTGGIDRLVPNPESIFRVDGKYFVYVGATTDLLRKLHFEFPDE